MPREAPGAFNQALMDLGGRGCLPNSAPCASSCPAAASLRRPGAGLPAGAAGASPEEGEAPGGKTVFLLLGPEGWPCGSGGIGGRKSVGVPGGGGWGGGGGGGAGAGADGPPGGRGRWGAGPRSPPTGGKRPGTWGRGGAGGGGMSLGRWG